MSKVSPFCSFIVFGDGILGVRGLIIPFSYILGVSNNVRFSLFHTIDNAISKNAASFAKRVILTSKKVHVSISYQPPLLSHRSNVRFSLFHTIDNAISKNAASFAKRVILTSKKVHVSISYQPPLLSHRF